MATGVLAQASELLKPTKEMKLPSWGTDPGSADLKSMAGPMEAATTYSPSDNALVSARLGKLLDGGGDWMTRARTKAMQGSAERGLSNSSIAATAGEAAAIDSALPIAQQDANTYATSERDNAAAKNTFGMASNQFGRDSATTQFKGVLDLAAQGQQLDFNRGQALSDAARADAANALDQQRIDISGRQLNADTAYRADDLAFRKDASGRDLGLKEQELQLNNEFRNKQLDTQASQQSENNDRQARTALQGDIARMRQQASQAQAALEADPNMSGPAKRDAIVAISQKASDDIAELVRFSGLDMPDAWPDWVNQIGTNTNTAAAREDGANAGNTPSGGAGGSNQTTVGGGNGAASDYSYNPGGA